MLNVAVRIDRFFGNDPEYVVRQKEHAHLQMALQIQKHYGHLSTYTVRYSIEEQSVGPDTEYIIRATVITG